MLDYTVPKGKSLHGLNYLFVDVSSFCNARKQAVTVVVETDGSES